MSENKKPLVRFVAALTAALAIVQFVAVGVIIAAGAQMIRVASGKRPFIQQRCTYDGPVSDCAWRFQRCDLESRNELATAVRQCTAAGGGAITGQLSESCFNLECEIPTSGEQR